MTGWRSRTYALEYTRQRGSRKRDPSRDEFLSKYLPQPPSLVLDAGGGSGIWSLGFYELGYEVCLVDLNPHMLRIAREILKNTKVHIILCDIRFLPFRSEIFDFVLCEADPISQCGSKDGAVTALKSLIRVLKRGSILTGSITNRYFCALRMMSQAKNPKDLKELLKILESGVFKPKKGYKMYLFTPDEFRHETSEMGFRCLEMIPYIGLIASQFLPSDYRGDFSAHIINKIERKLLQDKHTMYFSRRFRFALAKP